MKRGFRGVPLTRPHNTNATILLNVVKSGRPKICGITESILSCPFISGLPEIFEKVRKSLEQISRQQAESCLQTSVQSLSFCSKIRSMRLKSHTNSNMILEMTYHGRTAWTNCKRGL